MHKLHPYSKMDEKLRQQLSDKAKETATKFIEHVEKYRDRKIKVPKEERDKILYQADIWLGRKVVETG